MDEIVAEGGYHSGSLDQKPDLNQACCSSSFETLLAGSL